MAKAAVTIPADTESHADVGRLASGLETATEFAQDDGDEVELVFDGAGTQWVPRLEDEDSDDHDGHPSIRSLVDDDYESITF